MRSLNGIFAPPPLPSPSAGLLLPPWQGSAPTEPLFTDPGSLLPSPLGVSFQNPHILRLAFGPGNAEAVDIHLTGKLIEKLRDCL